MRGGRLKPSAAFVLAGINAGDDFAGLLDRFGGFCYFFNGMNRISHRQTAAFLALAVSVTMMVALHTVHGLCHSHFDLLADNESHCHFDRDGPADEREAEVFIPLKRVHIESCFICDLYKFYIPGLTEKPVLTFRGPADGLPEGEYSLALCRRNPPTGIRAPPFFNV